MFSRFVCCFTAGKTRYRNFHPYHVENMIWPWHRFSFHRVFFVVGAVVCFAREWERNFLIFDSPVPSPALERISLYIMYGFLCFVSIFPKWRLTLRTGGLAEACFPVTADGRSQNAADETTVLASATRFSCKLSSAPDKQNKRACGNFLSSQIINLKPVPPFHFEFAKVFFTTPQNEY